jgi:tRNA dimethylallyltransferase
LVHCHRNSDPRLPSVKALGLPQLKAHLEGASSLDEAVALAKRDTRRFAKRQMTWFRNQMGDWPRVDPREGGSGGGRQLASISLAQKS